MMKILMIYFILANIVGIGIMGYDKIKAIRGERRISEKTLFVVSLIGGSIGTLAGMYLFHHKTKHWYFIVGMPAILVFQGIIGIVILVMR